VLCCLSCQCQSSVAIVVDLPYILLCTTTSNFNFGMQSKINLFSSSALRGMQMLLGVVVLGLSVTLINGHNQGWKNQGNAPAPPSILPLAAAIGAVSLVAAIFSLVIAWTNFLREYIEMAVDVAVILLNIVGGVVSCRTWTTSISIETNHRVDHCNQATRQELQ